MIAKEKAPRQARNKFEKAGDAAEQQMAFYLRRAYAEDDRVRVFNDLRVERQGEVAQIDHLLLHKHGMIIVESKSVTGEIHVNDQFEFTRVYGRKRTGMPSPIEQASRQGELLRKLLIDNREQLRNKKLFGLQQGGFKFCPIQVLVAISDNGQIKRPRKPPPELHKADQIVNEANALIDRHAKGARLLKDDGDWGIYSFESGEFDRVTEHLLKRHTEPTSKTPRAQTDNSVSPAGASVPSKLPAYLCTHCHSTKLEIRFGRSYYFKCLDCDSNTPIKNTCSVCGGGTKTSKRGPEFNAVCLKCDLAKLFFRNGTPNQQP